jgi:hypothetical protein
MASYDALARGAQERVSLYSHHSLLHNRSGALARVSVVALPSFDPGWFGPNGPGRQLLIVIVLAAIAIIALLVAGTAHLRGQRHRARRPEDEELFTTTPLPLPKEELARLARESTPYHAFSGLRIPGWVQAGSLLVALGITYAVAQRVAPKDDRANPRAEEQRDHTAASASDSADDTPEDLDLAPDSAPPFAFRVRDWVPRNGGGCSGQLIVTQGDPSAWSLTARVHDGQGRLLDTARARVPALRAGDVVEFTFPHADCDRIGAWDVHGARNTR